jgi:hypothetical protein
VNEMADCYLDITVKELRDQKIAVICMLANTKDPECSWRVPADLA